MRQFARLMWVCAAALALSPAYSVSSAGLQVRAFANYETAGVIITLPPGTNGNETATASIKGPTDTTYRRGHDFVRYDANNMATSFFALAADTEYDVRVQYSDPDGVPQDAYVRVRTKPLFRMPVPRRTLAVSPGPAGTNRLQDAIDTALPGDEIRVRPGVYGPVVISGRLLTAGSPIVLRAHDPANKPVIDGGGTGMAFHIFKSAFWVIDGFEVRNAGTRAAGALGVLIDGSAHIVVQNCVIHDNGYYNLLINHDFWHPGGITQGGHHLIQQNTIYNAKHGIQLDNGVGPQTVIRANTVYGHYDDAKLLGNEAVNLDGTAGGARQVSESTPHVLAITGGIWGEHDVDFYDNTMYGAQDNDVELDGIGVNIRVFRNRFISDNVKSPFSMAPSIPGPFFVTRNLMKGRWDEGAVKMNTWGNSAIPERNVFFYHNSIVKTGGLGRAIINLWYDKGTHNVPIRNIVFRNNVITSQVGGIQATDAVEKNGGHAQPSFNYNLWFVPGTLLWNLFEWQAGSTSQNYGSFAAFQVGTLQELNGRFADPLVDAQFHLRPGSAAIDTGARLPGINDQFVGAGPDLGAFELTSTSQPPAPTPALPSALRPTADAYVRDGAQASSNFGSSGSLEVKDQAGSGSGYNRITYLKFNISTVSGTVTSAFLRLYCRGLSRANVPIRVMAVYQDGWSEDVITWKAKPVMGSQLASTTISAPGAWYRFEITGFVDGQLKGDDVISLAVLDNGSHDSLVTFDSREGTNDPVLDITTK